MEIQGDTEAVAGGSNVALQELLKYCRTPETKPKPEPEPPAEAVHLAVTADVDGVCDGCGDTEYWQDVYGSNDKCWNCQPPPAMSLVGKRWFFDHHGRTWLVTIEDGQECCRLKK